MLEGLFGKAQGDKGRAGGKRAPVTESVPESQHNLPPVTAGDSSSSIVIRVCSVCRRRIFDPQSNLFSDLEAGSAG